MGIIDQVDKARNVATAMGTSKCSKDWTGCMIQNIEAQDLQDFLRREQVAAKSITLTILG